ncbi:hypothetical protein [Vreelandella titanicae]|uniref:hypothetical protein n=1 Tax=Vreelandella titanicae TaxID=664683 RepID=UPI0039BF1F64
MRAVSMVSATASSGMRPSPSSGAKPPESRRAWRWNSNSASPSRVSQKGGWRYRASAGAFDRCHGALCRGSLHPYPYVIKRALASAIDDGATVGVDRLAADEGGLATGQCLRLGVDPELANNIHLRVICEGTATGHACIQRRP